MISDDNNKTDDDIFDDEFSDEELGEGFDDYGDGSGSRTLMDMFNENPMFKIGVILGGFALVVGLLVLFGSSGKKEQPSILPPGSKVNETPGTSELSESYRQALEDVNEADVERAIREEDSSIPVPIDPPKARVAPPEEEEPEEDPLARWQRLQEERMRQQAIEQQARRSAQPKVDPRANAVNALAELMSGQMQHVMEAQTRSPKIEYMPATGPDWLISLEKQTLERRQAAREKAQQAAADQQDMKETSPAQEARDILVPAGEILYATTITEANTDAPGPVLAEIASGAVIGSRVLGSFKSTDNFLIISFNTIVIDGYSQPINAVALDPETTLTGLATDVNRRYMKRILLPAAGAFVEGLADAISESGRTTITISGDSTTTSQSNDEQDNDQEVASGITEAAQEFREIMDEEVGDIETLIKVRAGTPMGLLIMEPIYKPGSVTAMRKKQEELEEEKRSLLLRKNSLRTTK